MQEFPVTPWRQARPPVSNDGSDAPYARSVYTRPRLTEVMRTPMSQVGHCFPCCGHRGFGIGESAFFSEYGFFRIEHLERERAAVAEHDGLQGRLFCTRRFFLR